MSVYVGIDPGAKGAVCLLKPLERQITFYPTPSMDFTGKQLYDMLKRLQVDSLIHGIGVEDVHAIHGTSAGSNFKFGYNVGEINTIVSITGIGYDLITPKQWQKDCGIKFKYPKKATPSKKANIRKKTIADHALRQYPYAEILGPRGGLLDGRADALMIAHAIYLKYGGRNNP